VTLEKLPLLPNGKVDQKALPEPDEFLMESGAKFIKPRTDIERRVAEVWQDVLHLEKVGIHDNFFDIGGHSLSMVKVHNQLCELLKKDISIVEMFKHPTVCALARFLSDEQINKELYKAKQERAAQQRKALDAQRQRITDRRKVT
jgi:hypothetical protein